MPVHDYPTLETELTAALIGIFENLSGASAAAKAASVADAIRNALADNDTGIDVTGVPDDSYFLVGTAPGATGWEAGTTVRDSMGLGAADDPTFDNLIVSTITAGTIGYTPGGAVHEFGGTVSVSDGLFIASDDAGNTGFIFRLFNADFATLQGSATCSVFANLMLNTFTREVAGSSVLRFLAAVSDGTSLEIISYGFTGATTNRKLYLFYDINGSTVAHYLSTSAGTSYLCGQGNVLGVGHASPSSSYALDVHDTSNTGFVANFENDSTNSSSDGLRVKLDVGAANSGNYFLEFVDGGGNVGEIPGDGTGVLFVTTSDRALKTDIEPAPSTLSDVRAWPVSRFRWRKTGEMAVSFIAQELHALCPEAVFDPRPRNAARLCVSYTMTTEGLPGDKGKVAPDDVRQITECIAATYLPTLIARPEVSRVTSRPLARGDEGWANWGYDSGRLVPKLVKATQEMADTIDTQAALIVSLGARLEALEART